MLKGNWLHTALRFLATGVIALTAVLPLKAQQSTAAKREHIKMDFDWRFAFGHPYNTAKDFNNGTSYFSYLAKAGYGDGAAAADFDDRSWRKVDVPHDWAVEQPFSGRGSFSHGSKALGRNFPEASVGWYRKSFSIPATDLGRRIHIAFDGVFRNSIVWVNGHYLGNEPSGYLGFEYDITDYLNYGGNNVIAVRADATMEEGWFYEGAGIYRHVWLNKTDQVHVAVNGTFVNTQLNGNQANITAKVTIVNEEKKARTVEVVQTVVDKNGNPVGTKKTTGTTIKPFESNELAMDFTVADPKLWSLEAPYLHKLLTDVVENGVVLDHYETTFGIRTVHFDPDKGFFLNGKPLKIKGTNNHQDHAGVGSAIPDALQDYRILALKALGSNAYRCSHNPPTPELLDACDRLGMLVIDENRLMGITSTHLNDFKRLLLRDRNHPSVISWSIGNEEWGIENSVTGARIATTMQAFAKSIDTTRVITAAFSGGWGQGLSAVVDVVGYNYIAQENPDAQHKKFPLQSGWGTEEGSTFATRGVYFDDKDKHLIAAYDKKPRPSAYSIEEGWKYYAQRPFLGGMYIWTGFDYRGEPTPFGWPSVGSYFGMLDQCGFPKDDAWYLRSWWGDKTVLHILPHWNWAGKEGQPIDVWVYSNYSEVELFLNKKSLGKKKMELNSHLEWKVPYTGGILEAVGYKNGTKAALETVKTTGAPKNISLTADRAKIVADRQDVSVITVKTTDKNKLDVPDANNDITFSIQGPGKIIGVGNGDPTSLDPDKFIETIKTVKIEGLKEKYVDATDNRPEVAADFDDSSWQIAFKENRDQEFGKRVKAIVYRGSFTISDNADLAEITLFYKSIGTSQSIYINGKEIAKNLSGDDKRNELKLNKANLKAGKNVIAIVAAPLLKEREWSNINTDPGLIQVILPAEAYKRKLFSGLAQVIVQSTGEAGEITLTATSAGLKPAVIKINAQIAK